MLDNPEDCIQSGHFALQDGWHLFYSEQSKEPVAAIGDLLGRLRACCPADSVTATMLSE